MRPDYRHRREHRDPPHPVTAPPLGRDGTRLWTRIWVSGSWLTESDTAQVLRCCEQVDKRTALRVTPRVDGPTMRLLDTAIRDGLTALGFDVAGRARLQLIELLPDELS